MTHVISPAVVALGCRLSQDEPEAYAAYTKYCIERFCAKNDMPVPKHPGQFTLLWNLTRKPGPDIMHWKRLDMARFYWWHLRRWLPEQEKTNVN